ncbi:MAG TPA: ABC transporter permease [Chloroflexota bacterium]|nr:ABC transporter permease [Chloroflexota bacterium]
MGSEAYLPLAARVGDETVPVRQIGQWALVWRRFSRHRLAFWSMRVLYLIAALAIVGPSLAPSIPTNTFAQHIPLGAPPRFWPFSLRYVMGTYGVYGGGVSVSTYVLAGARWTLEVGVVGAIVASIIGSLVGATAGYFGRSLDAILMRLVDAILTVPFLPLVMLLSTFRTDWSSLSLGVMFGLVGWPGVARLVRGNVLSLREWEFADAARALGASDARVILRHYLPNTLDIIIVATTLNVALFILADVSLEFIIPSATPGVFTWGQAFSLAFQGVPFGHWWTLAFPGFFLMLTVLAVNFVGDGLRDALDAEGRHDIGKTSTRSHLEVRLLSLAIGGAGLVADRVGALASSPPAMGVRSHARTVRAAAIGGLGRVLPAARPGGSSAVRRLYDSPPWWLRFLPLAAVLLAGETVMLSSHSPLVYAPNFTSPVTYGSIPSQEAFAVALVAHGDVAVLAFESVNRVELLRLTAPGRLLGRTTVGTDASLSRLSLAVEGGEELGVWVSGDSTSVDGALVAGDRIQRLRLNGGNGSVQEPFIAAAPGGFAVVYSWQPGSSNATRVYETFVSASGTVSPPRLLVASPRLGLFPHAIADARGRLDLFWMDYAGNDEWNWRFRRFTAGGVPLGRVFTLEQVGYAPMGLQIHVIQDAVPYTWSFDARSDPHGNIWAAWGDDQGVSVAEWDKRGSLTYPPTPIQTMTGTSGTSVPLPFSLVPEAKGFQVYYQSGTVKDGASSIRMQGYDANANAIAPYDERIDYAGGGAEIDPTAFTLGGRTYVLFDKVRVDSGTLEGTVYGPARPPDLLTRLGLNIGNPFVNALLVLVGSVGAGICIALANVGLVLLLLLVWGVIALVVPSPLRWPVYGAILALVMVWLFNPSATPPGFVFIIHDLGWPGGWLAALGGAFVGIWSGLTMFRRFESVFRALSMAFAAILFVAALYAVTIIQTEITRI